MPAEFLRSIYAALLDNGIAFDAIDRMPYGRYMDIMADRARRRQKATEKNDTVAGRGQEKKMIYLRNGTIDEVFG